MNFSKLKLWAKAVRAPFSTATIIPVALGSIAAWHDTNHFIWMRFWLAMTGALLIHFGTNLANDYFDHRSGCDEANLTPTPFSGGSRMIQKGLIPPRQILYAALTAFALGSIIGFYLNAVCDKNVILILGMIGVFLGFFYSANPIQLGYGSFGELATGIGFGPLMVMGAYYVQTQTLSFRIFLISIPVGILIALVLFINEFPDFFADQSVGKKTLVVILSREKAVITYHLLLAFTYLFILFLILFNFIPPICLVSFLSLPLAIKAFTVSKKNFDKVPELLPANASTIGLHFLTGLLLCAGFVIDKFFFQS